MTLPSDTVERLRLRELADANGWAISCGTRDGMYIVAVGKDHRLFGRADDLVPALEARARARTPLKGVR